MEYGHRANQAWWKKSVLHQTLGSRIVALISVDMGVPGGRSAPLYPLLRVFPSLVGSTVDSFVVECFLVVEEKNMDWRVYRDYLELSPWNQRRFVVWKSDLAFAERLLSCF
jgi:hypothetical protein